MTGPVLVDDGTRGATLSPCGRYRYDLWRRWDDGPLMGWIMLNPSIADADRDDQTLRRCIGFARREGAAGVVIRNLYAYRTPKPRVLLDALRAGVDVTGPDNEQWLRDLASDRFAVRPIVAAWGAPGRYAEERIRRIAELFAGRLHRLDTHGHPAGGRTLTPHPLYLPATTPIVPLAEAHRS